MRRLNILVDMDDVLVDLLPTWVKHLNYLYGTDVDYNEIKGWDMTQYFPDITEEDMVAVLQSKEFWRLVKPKESAVSTLQLLLASGHKVMVVTSSHYETVANKIRECLLYHFPFIEWEDVIVTSRKQMIRGDVLVDDGIHNLIGGEYAKILMDMPHNQSVNTEKYGVTRVRDWTEAYLEICKLRNKLEGREKEMTIQNNTYVLPVAPIPNIPTARKIEMTTPSITLFTTGCPKCNVLKQKLDDKGVSYTVNTSKEQMESLGIKQVPVLKVDEEILTFVEANEWVNQQKG